jgi:hypothetical protein
VASQARRPGLRFAKPGARPSSRGLDLHASNTFFFVYQQFDSGIIFFSPSFFSPLSFLRAFAISTSCPQIPFKDNFTTHSTPFFFGSTAHSTLPPVSVGTIAIRKSQLPTQLTFVAIAFAWLTPSLSKTTPLLKFPFFLLHFV